MSKRAFGLLSVNDNGKFNDFHILRTVCYYKKLRLGKSVESIIDGIYTLYFGNMWHDLISF